MKSEKIQKELQELKEYIDTIATTAKLLDYKVLTHPTISVWKKGHTTPFMKIKLSSTFDTTWLRTDYKGTIILRGNITHEEKINQLKKLLEAL